MLERAWFRLVPVLMVFLAAQVVVVGGNLAAGGIAALALVVLIAFRPEIGAFTYLAVTPLVAGISRDLFLPVLRIHEALLAMIVAGLLLRGLVRMLMGHRYQLSLTRLDMAVVALAVTGSLVSLLWRFSQGGEIVTDDFLYAAVFWKYLALYAVFRVAVRGSRHARTALWISLLVTGLVGLIAILQALGLFGVPELLFTYYPPFLGDTVDVGRGASTLALTFAVADISLICLGAASVMIKEATGRRRQILIGLAALYLLGTIAAGQFSGYIGILVALFAIGHALGETRRVLRYALPGLALGGLVLSPVIANRLAGFQTRNGLPQSWSGRLDNLERFILPEFGNGWNILFGVRPAARVPAPESWRDFVFIESGYVWLLWSGGIPLLIAFFWFLRVCLQKLRETMKAREVELRAIGTAAFVGLWVIAVLTIFDPHLTMRGVADLMFPLLAMAQIAAATARPSEEPSESDRLVPV